MGTDSSKIAAGGDCLPPFTVADQQQRHLIGPLLKQVSRSFYLTLRVLPPEIRPQISLAYLLARATDTVADTKVVPRAERIGLLRELGTAVSAAGAAPTIPRLVADQATPGERELIRRLGDCFAALGRFHEADARRIGDLLAIIVSGQVFDLERFPGETEREVTALVSAAELDRYTYLVAGCVGEFWTRMCAARVTGLEDWKDGRMEAAGVRFGKGLQLVNILRDVPKDLRIGRCYLPVTEPERLLDPASFPQVRDLYHHWLDEAVAHLAAGWEYTLAIPKSRARLRLACAWPIWIGLRTIARLRQVNPLDPSQRVKVSRPEVYALMGQSALLVYSDTALRRCGGALLRAAR